MTDRTPSSEAGSALLSAIIIIGLMLALIGAMTMIMVADAQAVVDASQRQAAFYVAETGLATAKWEIVDSQDPQGDGIGTLSFSTVNGSCNVTAVDLGAGRYDLTSSGLCGSTTVVLNEVVMVTGGSKFPPGAFSDIGPDSDTLFEFSSGSNVVIDGGDSPGLVFTDADEYQNACDQLSDAITSGYLLPQNVTGSILNILSGSPQVSIHYSQPTATTSKVCNSLYTDFRAFMSNSFLPKIANTPLSSSSPIVYGTASNPVTILLPPDQGLNTGQTVTGFGTLVMPKRFIINAGASVNWTGNVILYGSDNNRAELQVDGDLKVQGNLLIVGGRGGDVRFEAKGDVAVDGALTAIADYTQDDTRLEMRFEKNLVVNGLLTALSPSNETRFDTGSNTKITGSYQLGPTIESTCKLATRLRFDSSTKIYKSTPLIQAGAAALRRLGVDLGNSVLSDGLTQNTSTTLSWYEKK